MISLSSDLAHDPMNEPLSAKPDQVVGLVPWLPWPFSAWSWWTEPVRAERLAAMRIGVALCLILDIALNYAPEVHNFFAPSSLGDPAVFRWHFESWRLTWSLLRGVSDTTLLYLALALCTVLTCWILGAAFVRLLFIHKNPPADDRSGIALTLWAVSFAWYIAGFWLPMVLTNQRNFLAFCVPLAGFLLACLFLALDLALRWRDPTHRIAWLPQSSALLTALTLSACGFILWQLEEVDATAWWVHLLQPWQEDDFLLMTAMVLWMAFACLLLVGCCTRFAAVMTWMMSMSFANLNSSLDNAGDTIRMIMLFYLMLCPCGAGWSVDAWWKKRAGPVYVHPWPLRLLFVQMIFIYGVNGACKLVGETWLQGNSLHYVLGDATLTRFSPFTLPLPWFLTRILTWSVLAWEVTFPLMVLWKWPRRLALGFGVLFHLGIFATMELGGFVPYMLCLYLPLLPWERCWRERKAVSGKRSNPKVG